MDLDLDELLATRKLHGLDKINDNDIYIDNIKEDIKIINNFITYFNKNIQDGNKADLIVLGEEINAIEHILSYYKRVLKENEELKILEDDIQDKRIVYIDTTEFEENYIPKQKIKDKIEELTNTKGDFATYIAISERIQVLQELLQEEDK